MAVRLRGAPRSKPTPNRETSDTSGLKRTNHGCWVKLQKPRMPPAGPESPSDINGLLQKVHYEIVRDWDNLDTTAREAAMKSLQQAKSFGFAGTLTQWFYNVLAGKIVHGEVTRTPRKLQLKLQ